MAGFRERMAQLKQRAGDFGSDAVSKWKQAGERSRGGSDGNTSYFGSSPLQQAMSQQQTGNTTTEGRALMDRTMGTNPSEMHRQAQMMDSGRQGEYGRGANAQGASAYTPTNEDFTTETVYPTTSDGSRAEGAPYEKKLDLNAGGGAELSNSVANNNVEAVNSGLMLDRYMKADPSKMNAQGIKDMQQELNNNGYRDSDGNPLQIDGRVGPKTSAAMGNYNKAYGKGVVENTAPERESKPITQKEDLIRGWQSKDILGRDYRPDPQGDNPYERTVYNQSPENYVDYQEPSTGYLDMEDLTNPLKN